MKQPQRLGDDFEFACSCNAPPTWKFCAAQSHGSGKPRRGHEKRCGSPKQQRGHEKHVRAGGNEPGTTHGRATARSCGGAPPRPRPTRGHKGLTQNARKFSARNSCPSLDSEHAPTQRKARAREEPSPGPPVPKTDARPPGHQPRGGAPARPRFSRGQEGST